MKKLHKQRVIDATDLSYHEVDELEYLGYYKVWKNNLEGKEKYYLFKPFYHESARHAILVFEIIRYLKEYAVKVKEYLTVRPDVVFQIGTQEYAIEVETGTILKKNRQQLTSKVQSLRRDFGNKWFFVVTDRNLVKAYKRYGKTYSKRNIISKLNKIIQKEWFAQQNR